MTNEPMDVVVGRHMRDAELEQMEMALSDVVAKLNICRRALRKIIDASDLQMRDGDFAREVSAEALLAIDQAKAKPLA